MMMNELQIVVGSLSFNFGKNFGLQDFIGLHWNDALSGGFCSECGVPLYTVPVQHVPTLHT
ncbi:hypothetical protein ALC57_15939 [Trachymyrmex cornetzi]|uniref:Uncharacterized protein n=1 Tax=Trachymyrmex cornetzi TaxID=471704 RepID=A0A151IVU7_9HYME|nr:hypothetical protein ALC57_15939 [Trachymyrmex cornetzi]